MAPEPGALLSTMRGIRLPGNSTVEQVTVPVPQAGHGQVLLRVRASSICGSDIRAIYREHLGRGAEAYRGVVAGHEPCGEVVDVGPGCVRLRPGDRVVVYHIVGCGQCEQCRRGYEIGCTDASRAAHGWQRDGGHADFLLAEERSCLALPDSLSFVDGALVSCGFGTAWEALLRLGLSGRDSLLVTGLGPVGLAAAMLGRALGAHPVVATDVARDRVELARSLGLVDEAVVVGPGDGAPAWQVSAAVDASGSAAARVAAVDALRPWGRVAFVGEGGRVDLEVSRQLIHQQVTVVGSWVTSLPHMAELLARLEEWGLHPEDIVTHRFGLDEADEAYAVADAGLAGKVCLVMGEDTDRG